MDMGLLRLAPAATAGAYEQKHVADTAMQRHSRKKAPKHSQCAALAGRRCWMAEARVRAKCLRVVRIAPQQSDCQNGALLLRSADGVAGALYRALTEKVGEATSTEGCERRNRPPPPTPVSSSIRKPGGAPRDAWRQSGVRAPLPHMHAGREATHKRILQRVDSRRKSVL